MGQEQELCPPGWGVPSRDAPPAAPGPTCTQAGVVGRTFAALSSRVSALMGNVS